MILAEFFHYTRHQLENFFGSTLQNPKISDFDTPSTSDQPQLWGRS